MQSDIALHKILLEHIRNGLGSGSHGAVSVLLMLVHHGSITIIKIYINPATEQTSNQSKKQGQKALDGIKG